MRRLITICAVFAIPLVFGSTALADFWMAPADLGNMGYVDGDPVGGSVTSVTQVSPLVYNYTGSTGATDSWAQVQIGYKWAPPGEAGANSYNGNAFPDLTSYESFEMSFHNNGDEAVWGNLWITAGYTDATTDEEGYYGQIATWVWVDAGDSTVLSLDFDDAQVWYEDWTGGTWQSKTDLGTGSTIGLLGHVTGIGFAVATNGDPAFDVDVNTVPVPGAVLLGILGLSAVGIKLRKFA